MGLGLGMHLQRQPGRRTTMVGVRSNDVIGANINSDLHECCAVISERTAHCLLGSHSGFLLRLTERAAWELFHAASLGVPKLGLWLI